MSVTGSSSKRIKLENNGGSHVDDEEQKELSESLDSEELEHNSDLDADHCSICLQTFIDRTVVPSCSHEFCFECILVWTEQSRRCPLCSQNIGPYLIHHVHSNYNYQKHYLLPLRTSPPPLRPLLPQTERRRIIREREWGRRRRRERDDEDDLERAIDKRRWVYQHNLYAKHVASNSYTRYRPCPTPSLFSATPDMITRATIFIRRELRVWVNLDVEFLTTFILSLMRSIDIRSESAVKLLAEFLDLDTAYVEGARFTNAEHFAHELYSYLRSPYRDLAMYDTMVQYDLPADIAPSHESEYSHRWDTPSRHSRSRSPRGNHPLRVNARRRPPEAMQAYALRLDAESEDHNPGAEPSQRLPKLTTNSDQKGIEQGQTLRDNDCVIDGTDVSGLTSRPSGLADANRHRKGKEREHAPERAITMGVLPVTVTDGHGHEVLGFGPSREVTDVNPAFPDVDDEHVHPPQKLTQVVGSTPPKDIRSPPKRSVIKINRNRYPLASAQAHLLKAKGEIIQGKKSLSNELKARSTLGQTQDRGTGAPTLLDRLSDPMCIISSDNAVQSGQVVAENPPALSQAIESPNKPAGSVTAGDDSSGSITENKPGGSTPRPAPPSLRVSLMQRLEDERARIFSNGNVPEHSNEPDGPLQLGDDLGTAEARLRSKARLRIRLAAEKRVAARDLESLATTEDIAGREFVGKTSEGYSGREDMLRAKLRSAKTDGHLRG